MVAKWNRGESSWVAPNMNSPAMESGKEMVGAKFMEGSTVLHAVAGENSGICFAQRNQGDSNHRENIMGDKYGNKDTIVTDPKRRRVAGEDNMEMDNQNSVHGLHLTNGLKNLLEAGPGLQARLEQ